MGPFTSEGQTVTCAHGMVVMFVPFTGKWSQVIGTFATSANLKAEMLAKILRQQFLLKRVDYLSILLRVMALLGIGGCGKYWELKSSQTKSPAS